MVQISERSTVRIGRFLRSCFRSKLFGRNQHLGHIAAGEKQDAHNQRSACKPLACVVNTAREFGGRFTPAREMWTPLDLVITRIAITFYEWHNDDARFKTRWTKREFGKDDQRRSNHEKRIWEGGEQHVLPVRKHTRIRSDLIEADGEDSKVEYQVNRHKKHHNTDCFLQTTQEKRTQTRAKN